MEDVLKQFDLSSLDALMIVVGAFLFVTLWQLAARYLFGPYLKLVEAREAATSGAVDTIRNKKNQIESARVSYERVVTEGRVAAMKEKLAAVSAAKKEAAQITEKAEKEAHEALKQGRTALQGELDALRQESLKHVDSLAQGIVSKITGRGAQA